MLISLIFIVFFLYLCYDGLMMFGGQVLVSRMIIQSKLNRTCFKTTARGIHSEEKYGKGFFRGYSGSFGTGLMTSIIW
jgi:hypothetical protein